MRRSNHPCFERRPSTQLTHPSCLCPFSTIHPRVVWQLWMEANVENPAFLIYDNLLIWLVSPSRFTVCKLIDSTHIIEWYTVAMFARKLLRPYYSSQLAKNEIITVLTGEKWPILTAERLKGLILRELLSTGDVDIGFQRSFPRQTHQLLRNI